MNRVKVIAVFDIGKTNKKILLFDHQFTIAYQFEEKFPTSTDEDGFECDDIALIQKWMIETLISIVEEGKYDIQGINFSTYGASLAFLDDKGEILTPIYNYLKEVDPEIQDKLFNKNGGVKEFCRKTASPSLGLLLNSGIQMLWLKKEKQEIFNKAKDIMHFPQYLSYLLTGKVTSEPTSIGCHTFMWDFDQMNYHAWIKKEGITLPEPVTNDTVLDAEIAGNIIKTGVGIHDSSASLVPYLQKSKEEFILISTGTWCISMNPFNNEPLTSNQLNNDCLCFLTPQKRQVKSSRLFMGHFHEVWKDKLNDFFKVDPKYFRTIPYDTHLVNKAKELYGSAMKFFPLGIEKFEEGTAQVDLSVFSSFDEAYARMVIELTELCIKSLHLIIPQNDTSKTFYVTGGFARNQIFVTLLQQYFSNKNVVTSEIDNASALGAALVIAENLENFDVDKIELQLNKNINSKI